MKTGKLINNEKGVALVLALVMLFLMSLLGSMIFNTSTTEVQISRNFRTRQDAFYAAERGVQYSYGDSNVYSSIIPGTTNTVNVPVGAVSLQVGSSDAAGTVQYVGNGNPPRGSGVDVTQYQANYYVIDVTGTGSNNANLEMEAGNAKIVPKQ
ncbi:MAG: pilus assembly PilX N-terminal domain-containing protein [Deltaproteobacteria bacterium]